MIELFAALAVCALAQAPVAGPQESVVRSPHNLSASGTGAVHAVSENEVCIFCHAPHNSSPERPLWNRATPSDAYTIYASRSLVATPGQPTGMSKMCLSCHDGTVALGSVLSRSTQIAMVGGATTMPEGHGKIGTDLRDDHPVSFRYDNALVSRNAKLRSPGSLPQQLRLDSNSELQCTTCHDAHNNALGKFMSMRNDSSEMCKSCHTMGQTEVTGHLNCSSCHQPHSAPSGPYLLKRQTITGTCLSCHDGTVPMAANIASALQRASTHDTNSPVDPEPPIESHVNCADCHEPHTMGHGGSSGVSVPPNFGRINGMSDSGALLPTAAFSHQVCFKCHADTNTTAPAISRQVQQLNMRLQMSPSAVSFHPVMAPGRNPDVPSLLPPWTTASRVRCEDCHNSDSGRLAGGSGPNGVHGSNMRPLLVARYETADRTVESYSAYGLCYKCHDRNSILGDQSFREHRKHIVEVRTSCSACHDSHGIASAQGTLVNHSNLINFDTSIVLPVQQTGRREFRDLGQFRGECFLTCHGKTHSSNERYP